MKRTDLILQVFEAFKRDKISYCLLRNEDKIFTEPDLDLLVAKEDRAWLSPIFRALKFVEFSLPHTGSDQFFAAWPEDGTGSLVFHVAFVLHYGPLKFFHDPVEKEMLEHRTSVNGVDVPSAVDRYRLLFLHCVLDKQRFGKYESYFLETAKAQVLTPIQIPGLGTVHPPSVDADFLRQSLGKRKQIEQALFKQSLQKSLPTLFFRLVWLIVWKLLRLKPVRPGLCVAFIGMDGAGKTTTILKILQNINWPFYARKIYMGDNEYQIPYMKEFQEYKNSRSRKSAFISFGFFFLGTFDKWLRAVRADFSKRRGGIILSDRWFHDVLTYPETSEKSFKYKIKKWIFFLCPKPDLTILLDANPDIVQQRKNEFSREEIEIMRARYLKIAREIDPSIIIVNTNQPPEEVYLACWQLIGKRVVNP